MPSNHLILCCLLLLPPSIFPSIRVFSNESVLHIRWPKYWSFSFNISPSNEYSGLISYRIDWLDLLAAQGTRKSLLQNHRSHWSFITRAIIADGNGWSFVASFIFTWENNTDPYQASIHFSTSCADQYILWHVLKHFWTPNISMAITIYNRKSPNTQEHCFTFHGSNRVR